MADRPAAVVDGSPVTWEQLRAPLAELAGATALNEAVLDARLGARCRREGVVIGDEALGRERALLEQTVGGEGVMDRVRRERGLGPVRLAALLRRNAMLRALVQPRVSVSEGAVEQAYRLRHGESFRARVIVCPTREEGERALGRVRAGEEFSRVAAEMSVDASAARGGVIEPVNPADPSYPRVLCEALAALTPGQTSAVLLVDAGAVIARLDERVTPADPPAREAVRAESERDARLRQERLLMDELARRVLEDAPPPGGGGVKVLDPSLSWSVGTVGR